jgi:hypothetical protein
VVSGDFRFITSAPGQPETLATSTTVISDQAGSILQRIRALPGAANQTAVVQVTDLGTSAFRRATFNIAQATGSSPGFFTVPEEITFTGPNNLACATGTRADVSIFGGLAPYTIGNGGGAFSVSQNVVLQSGGSFYIVANGTCAENVAIPVSDSAGRTSIVRVTNALGTQAVPDLVVSPSTVTLAECGSQATVTVAGGLPTGFTVSVTSGAVVAFSNPSSRLIGIQRAPGQAATTPVLVGVASGDKVATITVNLTGDALNTRCDGSSLTATPNAVQIAGCGFADVLISGGAAPYTAISNSSAVTVPVNVPATNILRISRANPSAAIEAGTVTVFDSSVSNPRVSRSIAVSATGSCP